MFDGPLAEIDPGVMRVRFEMLPCSADPLAEIDVGVQITPKAFANFSLGLERKRQPQVLNPKKTC